MRTAKHTDTPGVEFLVALQYPNGRIHETVYHSARAMEPETEFELYGHTWRVVGLREKHHRSDLPAARPQFLCVAVEGFLRATG